MTFHPLPRKGEQETQEENNDNINNIPPSLSNQALSIIVWVGPCRDHPFLQTGKQRSAAGSKHF